MNVNQIKAQLLRNRKALSMLHSTLQFYKETKKSHDKFGNTGLEYICHNDIREIKPEIAKLVDLQKALKADLAKELSYLRSARRMALIMGV